MNTEPTDFRALLALLQRQHELVLARVPDDPEHADELLRQAKLLLRQIDRVQNQVLVQLTPEIAAALSNIVKAQASLEVAQQENAQAKLVLDGVTNLLTSVNGVLDLARIG